MKLFPRGTGRPTALWTAVGLVALLVSTFSISAPEAFAQAAAKPADDSRHYGQLLQNIYQFILGNYVDQPDAKKVYEGAMKGMLDALGDPHSFFLDSAMLSDMMEETEGSYAGVGLYISKQSAASDGSPDGARYIEVVSPIEDTPGWKAGVQPGDLIMKIDDEGTADLTVDQASAKIRGPEGTKVKLLLRRGRTMDLELEFVRTTIEIPSVKSAVIPWAGTKVGYVRIIEWIPQSADRVRKALESILAEGADSLVVDVRSNPGGLLDSVIDVSDLFLDSGMIVSTRGRNPQENQEYPARAGVSFPQGMRMAVLINRGSASASEIFAGAMKDTKRALLVGEKSYGKGSVQQIFPLDETGFKLTMAKYYTPSGRNIDKTGIPPDIESADVTLTDGQLNNLEALLKSGRIEAFASANPAAGVRERNDFAAALAKEGFDLPESYLRKLVQNALSRSSVQPVYDLEFDAQLRDTLMLITGQDFESRLKKAMTLGELAAVAAAKPVDGAASKPALR